MAEFQVKEKRKAAMETGRSFFDSIPHQIILNIFLKLQLRCVLRLKSVCKAWYVLIHNDFTDLYFKLSRENSFGIGIVISTGPHARDYDSKTMIPYEISSLQIGGGIKTLMIKNISAIGGCLSVRYSINGLIFLSDDDDFYVCNPSTGEFVTLPRFIHHPCPDTVTFMKRSIYETGFGYSPLTDQYKVIIIFQDFCEKKPVSKVKVAVGISSNSWRIIDDFPQYKYLGGRGTVCLNGTIYLMGFCDHRTHLVEVLAFDVADETVRKITPPPEIYDKTLPKLSELEGKLCLIDFNDLDPDEKSFEIYMMVEDHQWESRYTFFSKDFKLDFDYFLCCTQYQCLRHGKLIIWSELIDGWLFFDIKSKTYETIEVADSNFSISLFPYEESLASICSMNDILTANCLEVEANAP
nr:F-box protein At1g30790-like [Quercus suber]POF08269.1 f-box protein [Quercus suber]